MIIPWENLFQQNFWMGVTHSRWQGNIHFWESMCFFSISWNGLLSGLIVCEIVTYIAVILQWGLVAMCFVGVRMCWHVEFFHLQGPKSYNLNARELCIFLNWHKNPYHPWDERYIYLCIHEWLLIFMCFHVGKYIPYIPVPWMRHNLRKQPVMSATKKTSHPSRRVVWDRFFPKRASGVFC